MPEQTNALKSLITPRGEPGKQALDQCIILNTNAKGCVTGHNCSELPSSSQSRSWIRTGIKGLYRDKDRTSRFKDSHVPDGSVSCLWDRHLKVFGDIETNGMYSRVKDTETGELTSEWKRTDMCLIDYYSACLSAAFKAFDMVKRRTYSDELYAAAQNLYPVVCMFANREEFYILEQSISRTGLTIIPLYASLGRHACELIIQDISPSIFIADLESISKVNSWNLNKSWNLDHLVYLDSNIEDEVEDIVEQFMKTLSCNNAIRWSNLLEYGSKCDINYFIKSKKPFMDHPVYTNCTFSTRLNYHDLYKSSNLNKWYEVNFTSVELDHTKNNFKVTPDSVQSICYTSGTTGRSKGVIVTHRMILAHVIGTDNHVFTQGPMDFGTNDSMLSILPLAHMFERIITWMALTLGMKICIFSGNPRRLPEEMKQTKPSVMILVPRLMQRFMKVIEGKIDDKGSIIKALFNKAVAAKQDNAERLSNVEHWMLDPIFFNAIKEEFGGKLRLVLTGAAPMACSEQNKFSAIMSTQVCEGYGLSETCGTGTIRLIGDTKDSVGCLLPSLRMKLDNVPEMNITDSDFTREGEICLKGPGLTPGYFRWPMPEVFDEQGWFHTGDIGRIGIDGNIRLTDRRKALFKLCQGEYISPEKCENFLSGADGIVGQAFVTGRGDCRFPCAIIVPDPGSCEGWKGKAVINSATDEEEKKLWLEFLESNRSKFTDRIMASQKKSQELFGMQSYEICKEIYLQPFPLDSEEFLTPTFKLKRHNVKAHFKDIIEVMINNLLAAD